MYVCIYYIHIYIIYVLTALVRTRFEFQSPWLELVSPCHSSWRDDLLINPHHPGIPSDDRHESHPTLCSSTAISARQAPLVATALAATAQRGEPPADGKRRFARGLGWLATTAVTLAASDKGDR